MKITSMVGRFGGVVTYNDGTTGVFHTQFDKDQIWSIDVAESQETMRGLSWDYKAGNPDSYPYWRYIGRTISALPFMVLYWDTPTPAVEKTITSMAARLDFIFTTDDDKTYPVAIVMDDLEDGARIETPDLISDSTNLTTYLTKIQNMFLKIMDEAIVGHLGL